jgi:hypothetical protein
MKSVIFRDPTKMDIIMKIFVVITNNIVLSDRSENIKYLNFVLIHSNRFLFI